MIQPSTQHPTYSLDRLNMSIAHWLGTLYPNAKVYFGANQQDAVYPCFYITYPTDITRQRELDSTHMQNLNICLVYEESPQVNRQNAEQSYIQVADTLDANIRALTYCEFNNTYQVTNQIPLQSYEHKYKWDNMALRYSFSLKIRVIETNNDTNLATVNTTTGVKKG